MKENSEDLGSGVVAMKLRGVEHIAAIILLLLVAVSAGVLVYMWLTGFTSTGTSATANLETSVKGKAIIEAIKIGPGYIAIYVRGLQGDPYIDTVYLVSPSGALLSVIKLPYRVRVEPGKVAVIYIPILFFRGKVPPGPVYLKLGSSIGIVASTTRPVNVKYYVDQSAYQLSVGIFVDRGGRWNYGTYYTVLNVTPGLLYDDAILLYPLVGLYNYLYSNGQPLPSVSPGKGYTSIMTLTTSLPEPLSTYIKLNTTTFYADFYDLYYAINNATRYSELLYKYFGPFIVVVNPTWGVKEFEVYIHGQHGDIRQYYFPPVANSTYNVAVDLIILFEDLWMPGYYSVLDNYVDHVVRVTVFTNNTIAVWVYHCSGDYLHAFYLNPPSLDDIYKPMTLYENCGVTNAELNADPSLGTISAMGGNEQAVNQTGLLYIKPHNWDTDLTANVLTSHGVYVPYGNGEILTETPIRVK